MLRTGSLLLCLAFLAATSVASAVECSPLKTHDTRYTVCRVDLHKDHLQLLLYDEGGRAFNSFERISRSLASHNEQLAFAMNAGMYREDFSPMGLMVSDGHQIHRLNLASGGYGNFYIKPNGIFIVGTNGARIIQTPAYLTLGETGQLATQSGPLLVEGGQINPSLNPQGTSRLIRNGVGVVNPDQVVFAISEDLVTFYDFAQMFKEALRCVDALYLDGNVSSLYSASLGRDDSWVPLGPIFAVAVSSTH